MHPYVNLEESWHCWGGSWLAVLHRVRVRKRARSFPFKILFTVSITFLPQCFCCTFCSPQNNCTKVLQVSHYRKDFMLDIQFIPKQKFLIQFVSCCQEGYAEEATGFTRAIQNENSQKRGVRKTCSLWPSLRSLRSVQGCPGLSYHHVPKFHNPAKITTLRKKLAWLHTQPVFPYLASTHAGSPQNQKLVGNLFISLKNKITSDIQRAPLHI